MPDGNETLRALRRSLSARLSDRLEEIGWTESDLRDRLLELDFFDTVTPESQQRTVRNYLDGRRIPENDVVVRLLADQEPVDPQLVTFFRNVKALEHQREPSVFHSLAFGRQLVDPPPARSRQTRSTNAWAAAAELLNDAAGRGFRRRQKQRTVVIDAPGFETTLSSGGRHSTEWQQSVWRVLLAGFRVVHVLSWGDTSDPRLPAPVQAELVLNLLFAAATGTTYLPIIRASRESHRVIVAEDVGAVVVWERGAKDAPKGVELGVREPEVARRLARSCAAWMAEDIERSRRLLPSIELHREQDSFNALRFDMDLASAESAAGVTRRMIKSGPPVALVPDEVGEEHLKAWLAQAPESAMYLRLHAEARRRRGRAFAASMKQGAIYRDILTGQGIREYLSIDGGASASRGGPRWGLQYLAQKGRIAHIRHLADLVTTHDSYELAVADENALLIPVTDTWWAVTRGETSDSRAVFFLVNRPEEGYVGLRQGKLVDTGITNFVDSLIELTDLLWDAMPSSSTDPDLVAARLRAFADEAEQQLGAGPA